MKFSHLVFVIISSIILYACNKDNYYEGSDPLITTSVDTLLFDTVFTEVGSATKEFKIYNRESEDIFVDVKLVNSNQSPYKINVNGAPTSDAQNIRVRANDSIYVFATVTIDPDQPVSISPFVVEEYIEIESKNTKKKVLLESFGQNANYIPGKKSKGIRSLLSCDLGEVVWNDPKPYVIYGILFIDSCSLIVPAGTDIYVHGGIVRDDDNLYNDGIIYVLENGNIIANGTVDEPVTLQGDRLEDDYKRGGGQWTGVVFSPNSRNNNLKHTKLKNSIIGYRVDSLAQLSLNSCEISYTSGQGLIGYHANIDVENSLIHNNGLESIIFSYGGEYSIKHTTISSFSNQASALYMTNYTCFDPNDCKKTLDVNKLDADIINTIIVGNEDDELTIIDGSEGTDPASLDFDFSHCIIKVDDFINDYYPNFLTDDCPGCITYSTRDTLFTERVLGDYSLDSLSIAIDEGTVIPSITLDIINATRDANPDIGCYEYYHD